MAQMVKNLPAMQETWVQSLGLEDPLEEGMATHSSIFAWRIPWTEKPVGLVHGVTKSRTRLSDLHFHFFLSLYFLRIVELKTCVEEASFPCADELSYSFLSLSHCSTSCSWCLQCHETLLGILLT